MKKTILSPSPEMEKVEIKIGELQPPEGGGFNLRLESRLSC